MQYARKTKADVLALLAVGTLASGLALAQIPQTVQYGYDASGRLSTVTQADGTTQTYLYENASFPNAMTGMVDENGVLYSTWTYDAQGRATATSEAGGAGAHTLVYNADGSVTVTDALGAVRTFTFGRYGDRNLVQGISGSQCPTCSEGKATTYTLRGWVSSRTDYNDNVTTYVYDEDRSLELSRTEASGTANARTITTQWHATYRLPLLVTEPGRSTAYTYDSSGNQLTRTVTDTATSTSRTWAYTYNTYGQVLTADGPRTDVSDVTTYTWYECNTGGACGQLYTVTNALGQTTTYATYSNAGQPLTILDANGVTTTLTYDARQRLTSRSVAGETTGFEYWPTGLLKKVTLPDASYLSYGYDNAHRLTQIADAEGNRVMYTLDAAGNRTAENLYDPSNALTRTHSRVYNSLSQLWKDIDAAGTAAVTTEYGYDNNSNQTAINAPLTRNTVNQYDELNRLKQTTDPAGGITQFAYDANDNLTSVTDPRGLVTSYQYNGFGDLTQQTSPDTGVTQFGYDSGGNLASKLDARGQSATYSYDALNRLTQVQHSDQTFTYTYDTCLNGIGRLCGMTDASGSTAYQYDPQGRMTGKSQTVTRDAGFGSLTWTVGYAYTNGQLTQLTMPKGHQVNYSYDAAGRISAMSLTWGWNGGSTVSLLSDVLYDPAGQVRGWTWANGTLAVREYDLDGRISAIDSAGLSNYSHDAAGRITGINTDGSAPSWTYSGYDLLDRLTDASRSGLSRSYSYDANGNRLTQGGSFTDIYTYDPTSNRLDEIAGSIYRSYSHDAAGNVLSDSLNQYAYDGAGRLSAANGRGYHFNGLGQRVHKTYWQGNELIYSYDEAGHVLERCAAWNSICSDWDTQQFIWLDDIPVATILRTTTYNWEGYLDQTSMDIFNVHTDHLNTPRILTQTGAANAVVWTWSSDPFGVGAANGNPSNNEFIGTYVFDLRLPGQIYDQETGLYYNYFRDYDPVTGRYVESDPIGLEGGINTYAYAGGNPISYTDPTGENPAIPAAEYCLSNPLCATAASATTGVALTCLINPDLCKTAAKLACEDLSDAWDEFTKPMLSQDQKLSPGEIKKLKEKGYDPEALKGGKRTGQRDLFKDKKGNIVVKPKDGSGPGDPTGVNINNL